MDSIQPGAPLTRLRIALEQFAAAEVLRCESRRRRLSQRLVALIPDFRRVLEVGDHPGFERLDHALHRTLIEAASVGQLVPAWEDVWKTQSAEYRGQLQEFWPELRILVEEQIYLIETLCTFDPVAIEDAIHNHLMSSWFRALESGGGKPDGAADMLLRVTTYISYNLHRPLRLHDIARRIAFTSPGHLSRQLRLHHGVSFARYLQRLRLEKGAELLRRTQLTVGQIARRTGYPSASRFCEYFKRGYRQTPRRYRSLTAE